MKVARLDTYAVSIAYTRIEHASRIRRGGVTDVIVKLTTDDGLVGWGESCGSPNPASVEEAIRYASVFVLGRAPWEIEAVARDFFKKGLLDRRFRLGNHALSGVEQAMWDLCGKIWNAPVYRLFGGALRDEVDYFYFLERGTPEAIGRQGDDGVRRGYESFYLKVGIDANAEAAMLEALRGAIGPERRIYVDANEAWDVNEAIRLLTSWDRNWRIDLCEAPVAHELPRGMAEVRARVSCAISANEALGREIDVLRLIDSRAADVLCFSPYWVGSMRRMITMSHVAHLNGLKVIKHTHGEFGIAAAACQHVLLALPNTSWGNQQTAQFMADDIVVAPPPIATSPRWGTIERPGLGVEIDLEKLALYHESTLREGPFTPYAPQR